MKIWDRGSYECEKWEDGKVVFSFAGERLSGRYALFRAGRGERDWMIHRIDPPATPREPFPEAVVPMQARPGELPAGEGEWGAEILWGGVRALAYCRPGRIELKDAELEPIGSLYPEVRPLSRQFGAHEAVLDGELVVFGEAGTPSAERLAKRAAPGSQSALRRRARAHPATYVIYDLLYLDGEDLSAEPYRRRRELLDGLGLEGDAWQTPAYSSGRLAELLAAARQRGLAGIVLKRLDSPYAPGQRGDWLAVGANDSGVPYRSPGRKKHTASAADSLTEVDKVLYPATGFTEGDLIDWYAGLGEVLLRHLRGRPLTLKRYPDGVEGGSKRERLRIDDLDGLLAAVSRGGIELHASLSRAEEMERPTAAVFDLDPGEPAGLLECCEVALILRGMFEQLGLRSYPKTSGSKGLHLYLPLNTAVGYERTKPFARSVAETVEAKFGDRVVSRMTKSRRRGRVLIDWSQNDVHKTTVCAYSLRAGRIPTVSTPLAWDEVEAALGAADPDRLVFDHAALPGRVAERGDLFAPLLSERQSLA